MSAVGRRLLLLGLPRPSPAGAKKKIKLSNFQVNHIIRKSKLKNIVTGPCPSSSIKRNCQEDQEPATPFISLKKCLEPTVNEMMAYIRERCLAQNDRKRPYRTWPLTI